MILSMSNQALIFLTTIIIGFVIGFIYDILRVFRSIIPHNSVYVYLEDFIFWVFVGLGTFYILLNNNYGEIRFFSIAGSFLGMIAYSLLISKIFMKISIKVVDIIKKVILLLLTIFFTPFRLIYKLLEYPISLCRIKLTKVSLSSKKVLQKSKNYAKMKRKKLIKEFKIITKKI